MMYDALAFAMYCHQNKRCDRVVECRLASALLAKAAGALDWKSTRTLREVQKTDSKIGSETGSGTDAASLQQLAAFAKEHLPAGGSSKKLLTELLGCDPAELFSDMPKGVEVLQASD